MNKYVYVKEKKAFEIITEFVEDFLMLPITERYSKEYLKHCAILDEMAQVEQGWDYFKESNTFKKPIEITLDCQYISLNVGERMTVGYSADYDGEFEIVNNSTSIELLQGTDSVDIKALEVGSSEITLKFTSTDRRTVESTIHIEVVEKQIDQTV